MKMFRTVNMDVINECRFYFDFILPSELLVKRKSNFFAEVCSSIVCHFGFAKCVKCVRQLFFLLKLIKFFSLSFYILLPVMVNKDFHY